MEKKKSPNQTSALRGEADERKMTGRVLKMHQLAAAELRTVLRLAAGVRVRVLQHEKGGGGGREYLKT